MQVAVVVVTALPHTVTRSPVPGVGASSGRSLHRAINSAFFAKRFSWCAPFVRTVVRNAHGTTHVRGYTCRAATM